MGGGEIDNSTPVITLNHAPKDTVSAAGGEVYIDFETSHDWTSAIRIAPEESNDWYVLAFMSGDKGKGRTRLTLSENDRSTFRNISVVIYASSDTKRTEAVVEIAQRPKSEEGSQEPGEPEKTESTIISDVKTSISKDGESVEVAINALNEWSVESTESWCSVSPSTGAMGEETVTLTFAPNNETSERSVTVTFKFEDIEKSFTFTQEAGEYSPVTAVISADYRGPDFLFTIVDVTNNTSATVSAEVGLNVSTDYSMGNPKVSSIGVKEIAAGKTERFQVKTPGLAANSSFYAQPYAKVGDKTYLGETLSTRTESLYFYFAGDDKVFNLGESEATLPACLITNVPFDALAISADWITIKEYTDEHYKMYNYYTFKVDANSTDKDRTATITATSKEYGASATLTINQKKGAPSTGEVDGHAWVNLALPSGTLWATMNVGAEKPEEYGRYVAWGEIVTIGEEDLENVYNFKNYETYTKTSFSGDSYKFFHDEEYQDGDNIWQVGKTHVLHKYCKEDGLTSLESKDDVATVKWGDKWTMPTGDQVRELVENTYYVWTEDYKETGVKGGIFYRKKGDGATYNTKDDTHIFIPASGTASYQNFEGVEVRGTIWAKTMRDPKYASNPYYDVECLTFDNWVKYAMASTTNRASGLCVRAVVK